jgi:hypothetical protein
MRERAVGPALQEGGAMTTLRFAALKGDRLIGVRFRQFPVQVVRRPGSSRKPATLPQRKLVDIPDRGYFLE